MNASFSTVSKLCFTFLAVQKANDALSEDRPDDGHRAGLGGRLWWCGVFWGGHVGSYRRRVCFSQGAGRLIAGLRDGIAVIQENPPTKAVASQYKHKLKKEAGYGFWEPV